MHFPDREVVKVETQVGRDVFVRRLFVGQHDVQANRLSEAHIALAKMDFQEPNLTEKLTRVVDLIKLKAPDDISAPFTLGRYFLIQNDMPKPVDSFRGLFQYCFCQSDAHCRS